MKDCGIEWLGDIPANWKIAPIKSLFAIEKRIAGRLGYDVLSVTQKGLKIKDLTDMKGQHSSDYSKYQLVEPGDFVMNHMDLLTGWIDISKYSGVTSPDYRVFRLTGSAWAPYYLLVFQTYYNARIFYGNGKGISGKGRWRLPRPEFLNLAIPVPPLAQQRKIAEFLYNQCEKIDLAIEVAERSIEEYKAYKQSVIFEAVTKGLDSKAPMKDSGIEWLGDIPENWNTLCHKRFMTKVKDICDKWGQEDVMSLTVNGVVKRDLDNPKGKMPATFDGYQFVYPGNLLLCLFDIDVTPRCAGKIEDYGVTSPAYSQYALGEGFDVGYYTYYFIALDDQKLLLHLTPTMRSSFNADEFAKISAIAPPLSEQVEIAKHLDKVCGEIDAAISAKQSIIEELKAYKKALIYEVVTGKREIDGC